MKSLAFRYSISLSILALNCVLGYQSLAQPTLVSTIPLDGATGVSPSAAVVFTFSTAMNTAQTFAFFTDSGGSTFYPTSPSWSSGNTVLTCTPSPAFPGSTNISWTVFGSDTLGNPLNGTGSAMGSFTTGASSGGGAGSGTNATTTFLIGKSHYFDQTNNSAPSLDPTIPYNFLAVTSLASNRTATNITVTLPNSAVSNLTQNPLRPEFFSVFGFNTNLSAFDATFSSGSYVFKVSATASNQQVTVNLPAFAQPNSPHLTNFTAAQSVNPSQPFVLAWDPFTGGAATDYVGVVVGSVYQTPGFGASGALNGTATTLTIPANTLQANSNYDVTIGFYHALVSSNASYATIAYVASSTHFTLLTTSTNASSGSLILTNFARMSGTFGFDVLSSTGQTFTIEYSPIPRTNTWNTLLTTNSPGGRVHISDARSTTNRSLFYRARNGP